MRKQVLETDRDIQMQAAGKCCVVDLKILVNSSFDRNTVMDEIDRIFFRIYDQLDDDMDKILAGVEETSGERLEIREEDAHDE